MADRQTAYKDAVLVGFYVKAATTIYAGNLVAVDSTGYAVPAADTAGHKVVGIADEYVDNSTGASAAETVTVRSKCAVLLNNDDTNTVVQADVGGHVYVNDATTVDNDGGTNAVVAGRCLGIETAGVWVELPGDPDDGVIADPGDAGAIAVDKSGVCAITTEDAETRTLAIPTKVGQQVALVLDVDGGNCVVTVAGGVNQTGNNTITMGDAGDTVVLTGVQVAGALVWRLVVNDGTALSTV